ncbi:MAG TPA: hypothetical protein VMN79_01025 [Casimicrobiaceae bacterium]|nr:hypothetical protein [Casimicrobiaceae bacterium]
MKKRSKHAPTGTICRHPEAAEKALKRCQKGLDAVTFDRVLERARKASELRELRAAANAPIRKLIEQDKKAMRALAEVSRLQKEALGGRSLSVYSQTFGPFPSWSLDLSPGLHVFTPPFDLDRPGPTSGSPTKATADRDTGEIFVNCSYDSDAHGYRAASASIVIIFQPSVIGTLSVRPYTKYADTWTVAGLHLSAHSEGHLTITASRDDNGQVLDSRDITLWNQTTESDVNSGDDDGVAWPPDFQVNFLAEPGRNYLVAITASVSGDQSGDQSIGFFPSWSLFDGCISASVPWLVAELRP